MSELTDQQCAKIFCSTGADVLDPCPDYVYAIIRAAYRAGQESMGVCGRCHQRLTKFMRIKCPDCDDRGVVSK